jgi:hypothetical protein
VESDEPTVIWSNEEIAPPLRKKTLNERDEPIDDAS